MDIQSRRQQLLASADTDQHLRVLLSVGLQGFLEDDTATSDFLHLVFAEDIEAHNQGRCHCNLADGGYGYCYIAQWCEGCRPAWEVITELEHATFAAYFKKYFRAL